MMDKRKQTILLAVTKDYIATAEPVGSRSIVKHYRLGISPATARNEMADLEESGYLTQPHTSAGRIPSDKGYRFYVDVLMDAYELTKEERDTIILRMEQKRRDVESLITGVARLVADLCENAAVVLGPIVQRSRYKHISFVEMPGNRVMVILVATPGIVENQVVDVGYELSSSDLSIIANLLNEKLDGICLSSIDDKLIRRLAAQISRYTSLVDGADEFLKAVLEVGDDGRVYLEGASHMLIKPEFREVARVRSLFEFLERREVVRSMLRGMDGTGTVTTTIGKENEIEGLRECSVVQATYGYSGDVAGTIAVIGPTRMNYSRVVSIMRQISTSLSNALEDLQSG
jgi:heat-inducible transcriptional repressor